MPKKFAKEDVQGWTENDVESWLHSKGLKHCLSDFTSVNGLQLLSLTNDDLKSLPTVGGNDKKRKALKKALSQLPGNSVSKPKSKLVGNKSKEQLVPRPPHPLPSSSSFEEPVPAVPPHPPPTSAFHPPPSPQSPNSATYSDPSLVFPGSEELYDNPHDISSGWEQDSWDGMGQSQHKPPPPLPPHPNYPQQGVPQYSTGNYEEDQMIYDQYDDEDEFDDSSFASEEEEEEEMAGAAVNGVGNTSPHTGPGSQANIRAISAKFFAQGLTEHTGISTVSTSSPGLNHRQLVPVEECEDMEDDIYDLPPEEMRSHPPPPDIWPSGDPEGEDEEGDIYDIVEEVIQTPGYTPCEAVLAPPMPPDLLSSGENKEDHLLYDTAAAEEELPVLPSPFHAQSPQIEEEPPPPPRPPKPGFSPSIPRKEVPSPSLPIQPVKPATMHGPIRVVASVGMRQPLQSHTPATQPPIGLSVKPPTETLPLQTNPTEVAAPPVPPPPPLAAPPVPPPPPPITTKVSSSSPAGPCERDNLSSTSPHSNMNPQSSLSSHIFGGGRKFHRPSDNKLPSPQPGLRVQPDSSSPPGSAGESKPSEMKASRAGGMAVPGKFVSRQGAALKSPSKTEGEGEKRDKPPISDKPMSVLDRINMWKKSGGEGGGGGSRNSLNSPQKNTEGVSPLSGRKMTKERSVSDLINYHSEGGESERSLSPEQKPFLPPKPTGVSPNHISKSPQLRHPIGQQEIPPKPTGVSPNHISKSPQLKRRPIGQQEIPPKPTGASPKHINISKSPHLKRHPIGQQETPPPVLPERPSKPATETPPVKQDPPWKKTPSQEQREPPCKPAWQEKEPAKPAWQKREEKEPVKPVWQKREERNQSPKPWGRKMETEEKHEPPWKRVTEEREPQKMHQRWKVKEEENNRAPAPWKQRVEGKPEVPQKSEPPAPPALPPTSSAPQPAREHKAELSPESPSLPKKSFTYKPYSARRDSTSSAVSPPPVPESALPKTPPHLEPPRSKISPRSVPSPPPSPAEQQPQLPPRPPKPADEPPQNFEMPPEVPRLPLPQAQHNFKAAPEAPQLPQRPPPRHRPTTAVNSQEPEVAPPPRPQQSLAGQLWYHANLRDRRVAEARLMRYSEDGTFMIRDSSRKPGEYSLSLLYHGAVKHLRIRLRTDRLYVLGEEKPDELTFASVVDLVNYHKQESLVLRSGGEITLRYECPP